MKRRYVVLISTLLAIALLGYGCGPVRESEAHGPALPETAYIVAYPAGKECLYLAPNVSPERGFALQVGPKNFANELGGAAISIPTVDGQCQAPDGLAVERVEGEVHMYNPCAEMQTGGKLVRLYYCRRHEAPSPVVPTPYGGVEG